MLRLTRNAFTRKWRAGGIDIFRGASARLRKSPGQWQATSSELFRRSECRLGPPEEFTQCLVSHMDIGFRAFDSEKYHQKYHHFSVRLLCGAYETL